MKTIITGLFIFLLSTSLYAADTYLCITEHAAGIYYDKKKKTWRGTVLSNRNKFIVIREKKSQLAKWSVKTHGADNPLSYCNENFSKEGRLHCTGTADFTMNKKSKKFKAYSHAGYTETNNDSTKYTPLIEVGTCSTL